MQFGDDHALPDPERRAERLDRHRRASTRLAALDDEQVLRLLATGEATRTGIGGTTSTVHLDDDLPVFVKRVPLTDLERRPENLGSTANLFDLPTYYQYGIGSAGFGAWREVAVSRMATDWVLRGAYPGFPLTYHWRVLPQQPASADPAERERWVTWWQGSPQVRDRLVAIDTATASAVLFMERIPATVDTWLADQLRRDTTSAAAAAALVDRELSAGSAFLQSQGLLHFDAHFHNLLTDGRHVYFADFGLAVSSGFELSGAEREFFDRHAGYDGCYTATHLVRWLVSNQLGVPFRQTREYLRANAAGRTWPGLPAYAAQIVDRHAPLALVLMAFFQELQEASKATPYPAAELRRVLGP